MWLYTLFIFAVALLLYADYATNLKLAYKASRVNINHLAISFAFATIVFFAGFRYEIGYDYSKYLAGFLFDAELDHWEPLFNFFTRMLREVNFGLDSQALFLFYSIVTIAILFLAIRKLTPYHRLSLLLYLLIPSLFLNSFSVLRQSISMVILLYGLYYLTVKVDKKRYMLFALAAFLFHYSSIFVVIVYLTLGRYFNRTYSWITYSTGVVLSFLLYVTHTGKYILMILPGQFSLYANTELDVSILKLLVVNLFFVFLVVQKKRFIKTKLDRYLLNSMFVATVIFNVFADFIYVTRIAQYFLIAEIILVPIYIYSFKNSYKKNVLLVLFFMYYLLNFEYALYRDVHFETGSRKHFLVPYENYFFTNRKSDKEKYRQRWYEFWEQIR